ncbi:hypothetical protein FUA23_00010 [Neolewinella aurantiaca]|uniref:Uncharacterized protein n=1 Tax=Neolewinella aurantiaca TaxID=2602767 RepID=A0A5C7G0D2_9BACT|nr:hypothetical protein [Neolewinella aurantiaca]TXF91603.1 hypothetical protein FUA23_00010 [Neolewinella aurantiaca]
MKSFIIQTIVLLLILSGCGSSDHPGKKLPTAGSTHQLLDSSTSIRLPTDFVRIDTEEYVHADPSSPLANWAIPVLQTTLDNLKFQDSSIDMFLDSTNRGTVLAIIDTKYIPLSKESGSMLASTIKKAQDSDMRHAYTTKNKSFKRNGTLGMMHFQYMVADVQLGGDPFYQGLFFLSSSQKIYVVYELSGKEASIKDYLWTLTE